MAPCRTQGPSPPRGPCGLLHLAARDSGGPEAEKGPRHRVRPAPRSPPGGMTCRAARPEYIPAETQTPSRAKRTSALRRHGASALSGLVNPVATLTGQAIYYSTKVTL